MLINTWDGLQGWIVVTLIGVLTAIIAGWIIQSEALLFDLKEGYCQRNWRLAKRFCCPYAGGPDWDGDAASWSYTSRLMSSSANDPAKGLLTGMNNRLLAGWAGPVAASPKWASLTEDGSCSGWITWGDRFSLKGEINWAADYAVYVGVAVSQFRW
jgi:chloride channel 3/4/5